MPRCRCVPCRLACQLSEVINHPALFEVYPQLARVRVVFDVRASHATATGSYARLDVDINESMRAGDPRIVITAPTTAMARLLLVHEIQHAIQDVEGWGLSEARSEKQAYKVMRKLEKQQGYDSAKETRDSRTRDGAGTVCLRGRAEHDKGGTTGRP
ncbi:MAG: hypothetical protein A3K19_12270 [Lentisphaerae bacterium RIFOXYB12_FULL_65_16]|nr:MAG: hypothetical protein A3K18_01955 [Lentisphaerae bacterium RIFOXYA12_64_32]OGV86105.1 MAG: hypothetical protein A3K19_12270 [Lentisphaerae bacterium RIFOXYB12_FULL_65_16]